MSRLQKRLALPRTTIASELYRLQDRGLVRADRVGRNNIWKSTLDHSVLRQPAGAAQGVFSEARVYEGVTEIKDLYRRALTIHKAERVTIVEGTQAVKTIADKAGVEFVASWHSVALERQLIMESLISEHTLRQVQAGDIAPEIITSLQRFVLWVGYVVPDNIINTNSALLVFRDSLILVDWNKELGMFIENREVVTLIRHLIEAYRAHARQVNLVKLINQL